MAKRKRSAALFEVINRSRPLDRQRHSGLLGAVSSVFRSDAGEPAGAGIGTLAPPAPLMPAPAPSSRSMDFDEDRQEVAVRVSYGSGAVALLAAITLLGGAFIAGRKTAPGVHSATAINTVDPRLGPVQVDVTDLPRTSVQIPNVTARTVADTNAPARVTPKAPEAKPNTPGVVTGKVRKEGYQYVVIQSYPDAKLADEARRVLADNGVESTVIQGLPGWNKWFCVLGTTGFERLTNNTQYDAYLKKIRAISASYAKKGSFKEFAPTPTRWDPKKR